jgi:hypothetical protein
LTMGRGYGKEVIFLRNPFLDFTGIICGSSRMVTVEAKMTDEPRLGIASKSGLSINQYGAGCNWYNAGALVGVIWQFHGIVAWVPWKNVRKAIMDGRRSIKFDLDTLPIKSGMGFILHDWLATALASE